MFEKKVWKKVPRAHLLALSTAGLLMGTGMMLNSGGSQALERKEVTLALATQPNEPDATSPTALQRALERQAPASGPAATGQTAPDFREPKSEMVTGTLASDPTAEYTLPEEVSGIEWKETRVRKGDSFSSLFKRMGLGSSLLYKIDHSLADKKWSRITPGQKIHFGIDQSGELVSLKIDKDKLTTWEISREDQKFALSKVTRETDIHTGYAEGTIDAVFYTAAQSAGLSDRLVMELANLFAWDIDFALDIRKGDAFKVIYEDVYLDGEKIGTGNILAAQFTNQGKTHTAIRYTHEDGYARYYDEKGGSVKKAFLRSPIDFARISSHFNPNRRHPVLHTIRAHRGTDYAARPGTPIKATGDAKVIFAGRKGGYGNVVILQHGQSITTLYAHMKGFARGVRSGKRVQQGDVIGYVGSTGLASGPHLHYEFRVNGIHKNPVTVKLPDAAPIAKQERSRFTSHAELVMAKLDTYASTYQVAFKDNTDIAPSL